MLELSRFCLFAIEVWFQSRRSIYIVPTINRAALFTVHPRAVGPKGHEVSQWEEICIKLL